MTFVTIEGLDFDLPSPVVGGRVLGEALRHVIVTALGTALVGALATFNISAWQAKPLEPAPAPQVAPVAWRDIVKPVRIYDLESPVFAGAPVTYVARRQDGDAGRQDVLVIGRFDGAKPALRLRMGRHVDDMPGNVPFDAAVAREAALAGLSVSRHGSTSLLRTRFGAFDVIDVDLIAVPGGQPLPCQAFRRSLDRPALSISGLVCGQRGAALSRAAAGCLIERLDVASAGDDRELVDFFAASELHRNLTCARLAPRAGLGTCRLARRRKRGRRRQSGHITAKFAPPLRFSCDGGVMMN